MIDTAPNAITSPTSESQRMKGALAYILLWLTGLIMLLLEPQDKFVKYNAMQAIVFGLVLTLVGWIPCVGWIIAFVGWLYALYGAYQVYSGREFKIPYVSEFVMKNLM